MCRHPSEGYTDSCSVGYAFINFEDVSLLGPLFFRLVTDCDQPYYIIDVGDPSPVLLEMLLTLHQFVRARAGYRW